MNTNTKVYYLKGWIKPGHIETMSPVEWLGSWTETAKKTEEEGYSLVVFKVPTKHESNAIVSLEQLLQKQYGIP